MTCLIEPTSPQSFEPAKRRSRLSPTKWIGLLPRTFSLRTLFVLMLLAVIGSLLVQRSITDRAHFKILETDLDVDGGYLSGSISFRCSRFNQYDNIEYADTVLRIEHLADTRTMDLEAGDEFSLRYRYLDFGPIKKENRYVLFMVRELGIRKDEIVGFVQLDGWAEVLVRGKPRELP